MRPGLGHTSLDPLRGAGRELAAWREVDAEYLRVAGRVGRCDGPGVARNDPDFFAAYIVNHILGGGSFSSRLYREVREKRGLAYGVSTTLVWLDHAAVLLGATATQADATGETIKVIEGEYRRLAAEGPTEEEFLTTKTYL